MWENNDIRELSASSLRALIENRIPAVRIEAFANTREIDALVDGLLESACRTHSIKQVTRLGISQYEQGVRNSKENYFSIAKQLDAEFAEIYARCFSPVNRLMQRLEAEGFNVGIMSEPGLGSYFAGNGKLRNGYSPVHVDFAPQDSAGWAVASARAQLAWNLYLRVPSRGGELLLWDKQWQPEDDRYQIAGKYFYDDRVTADVDRLRISVSPGEVIMINSRNFHAVSETWERLAFGSFISVFADEQLRLWS